jgi:hypothetical protein
VRADEFEDGLATLYEMAITSAGSSEAGLRLAAATRRDMPPELNTLIEKVHQHAYRVTDEDVAALREAGYDDDAIFELIVCAAVGAGTSRWRDAAALLLEEE